MSGIKEYVVLFEAEEDILAPDYPDQDMAIKARTAPGFTLVRKFDTDIDDNFQELPLDESLVPIHRR
jgi:hypothetical protein